MTIFGSYEWTWHLRQIQHTMNVGCTRLIYCFTTNSLCTCNAVKMMMSANMRWTMSNRNGLSSPQCVRRAGRSKERVAGNPQSTLRHQQQTDRSVKDRMPMMREWASTRVNGNSVCYILHELGYNANELVCTRYLLVKIKKKIVCVSIIIFSQMNSIKK